MKTQDKSVDKPEAYKPAFNKQVEKLCKLGAIDKELADFFDVCEKTINNWKVKYPQFLQSIKKGKDIADINVAESLYNRAVGCKVKDTKKKFKTFTPDGETEPIVDWHICLMNARRDFGKTRIGAEWMMERAEKLGKSL